MRPLTTQLFGSRGLARRGTRRTDQRLRVLSSANIAEGFGRFGPKDFANFLRIAIASEFETKNHLLKAETSSFITAAERDEGLLLIRRASKAAIELRRYVLSEQGRANAKRIDSRPRTRKNL